MTTKSPVRFNPTRIAALPAGEYTDPSTQGLQLRVREGAKGTSRTWLFRYKWRGRPLRIALGHFDPKQASSMALADAREAAHACRRQLDEGIDPRRARPRRRAVDTPIALSAAVSAENKHTIEFLASEFMERHIKPTRRRPEYAQAMIDKDIIPEWKGRDARTIKPREVIELLDKVVGRGSPVQANRTAGLLGQMFKFGIHRAIVETSPVQLLYRPGGKEKPRERSLSVDELQAFWANVEDAMRSAAFRLAPVLRILLLTGQRRGELALARWRDIDFEKKAWTIPAENSKTGKAHVVPLSDAAITQFERLKEKAGRSKFVFPNEDGDAPADAKLITRSVARSLKRFKEIGVATFTPHDLRRTCRTGLAKLKVEPHIAERVLNHSQEKIPGTYDVHDYMDEKREALEKWAAYLEGLRA